MRVARFSVADCPVRLGIVVGDEMVDPLHAMPGLPHDLQAWLPGGARSWRFLDALAIDAPRLSLASVTLHAPVAPSKLLALGANYQAHLDEISHLGIRPSTHQIWFNKQVSAVNGPFSDVVMPTISDQTDYEAELAVVIGRRTKNVSVDKALSAVGGYMVCNDISVRDVQMRAMTMTVGKSFDTHAPLGPWLVTADEVDDPQALMIRAWVNGELRQEASTSTMIHSVASQIAELSAVMTLEPGDVLSTGSPAGAGIGSRPPRYLRDGDRVRIEVEGLGAIENRFVRERAVS